jgi:uncharacterized protein YprB with RNaseH-like and TPR domain
MDLKSRLAQLDRLTRKTSARVSDKPVIRSLDQKEALSSLGLLAVETEHGCVWVKEHTDPIAPVLNGFPNMKGLFTRGPDLCPLPDDLVLMDTETTGLSGGTGTLVFQLGLSWWQGDRLITRQYFLPGPANEAAMLADVADRVRKFSTVVTFNGASFDLPLLRTRSLLNRVVDPFANLVSWDLLVPARRLWKNCLPNCRQGTVEKWVCGIQRGAGDIDGSLIPQTWFDFLATGSPGELNNVLTHNHRDMVGMARILGVLGQVGWWLNEGPGLNEDLPELGGWHDRAGWWAMGKTFERRNDSPAAAQCFRRAWRGGWGQLLGDDARVRFRRDALRNLKRGGHWDLVAEIIADGLNDGTDLLRLHREAAILYEHRLVDWGRALVHAEACGEEHRQSRLLMRIEKANAFNETRSEDGSAKCR